MVMERIRKWILAAGLVFVSSSAASAGTIFTAPAAQSFPAAQALCCTILNVSKGARAVTLEVWAYSGQFVGGGSNSGLGAKEASQSCVPTTAQGAYCRFVVQGSAKSFRTAALYYDDELYTAAVPGD
jgi:hypothetical protein